MGATKPNNITERYTCILFLLILAAGLYMRFHQYFMGRSLWEDEAHLAISFVRWGHLGLMSPLQNFQTAPILFLWSVETITDIFGFGEKALRAFPFIVSIASLPFFYYFVKSLTNDRLSALIAFLIVALNPTFIYYSAELKPYTIDVSAYMITGYLLFSENWRVRKHRTALLAIFGSFFILTTNTGVVTLFCAGVYRFSKWRFREIQLNKQFFKSLPKDDLIIFITWGLVYSANFFKFILRHPYGAGMRILWRDKFCPPDIFSSDFTQFIRSRIDDTLFTDMFCFTDQYYFGYVITGLLLLAVMAVLYRKQYQILFFTIVPILIHLIASMFKLYPFFYRFILYLLPAFTILLAIGVSTIVQLIKKRWYYIAASPVVVFFCYCCLVNALPKFPIWDREIKPTLDFINKYHPTEKIIITTPWTLYEYYDSVGYAKNNKDFEMIHWGLSSEEYYNHPLIKPIKQNYLLLYSANGFADGYDRVIKDLEANHSILDRFEYKTYAVVEIMPKQ